MFLYGSCTFNKWRGCTRWCRSRPTGSAVVAAIYKYTRTTDPDFRKIKILSKHLLASGWGGFSKSKSPSSLGTMQTWFPTGEPIHGRGSWLPTSHPTGFSEWGLSHISHAWNGSPQIRKKFHDFTNVYFPFFHIDNCLF